MRFGIKEIFLCLLILCAISTVSEAQTTSVSPTSPKADEENIACVPIMSEMIWLKVSVWSSRMAYLKDLTHKYFEVYDENKLQDIDFFKFDEQNNQYIIGFYKKDFMPDEKLRDVKIKVKLSKEKKNDYGEITVRQSQIEYDPYQN